MNIDNLNKGDNMSIRDDNVIREILGKLDTIVADSAETRTNLKIIETKLDMIDSRGCSESNKQIHALNAKVNTMAGGVAVVSIIFSGILAKLGLK